MRKPKHPEELSKIFPSELISYSGICQFYVYVFSLFRSIDRYTKKGILKHTREHIYTEQFTGENFVFVFLFGSHEMCWDCFVLFSLINMTHLAFPTKNSSKY